MKTESRQTIKNMFPVLWPLAKITAKGLLVIMIVLLIIHSILLVVWGRGLERKLDDLRAQGQPVDMADIAPKPVPDSDNAALLYKQAYDITDKILKDPAISKLPPLNRDALYIDELKDPEKQARAMPDVRVILGRSQAVFSLIEQGVNRPGCVFPVKWTDGANATMPHLSEIRRLSHWVTARGIIRAESGDMDGAVKDFLTGFNLADSVKDEQILISLLVRQACINNVLSGIKAVTQSHPVSYDQSRALFDRISKIDLESNYQQAIQGERAFSKWCFDAIRSSPTLIYELSDFQIMQNPSVPVRIAGTVAAYIWRPFSYKDQMILLDLTNEQSKTFKRPYRELMKSPNPFENVPRYAVFTRAFTPVYSNIAQNRDYAYARIGLAKTDLALHAYKSRLGVYPESLDQLRQKLDWEIPDDPFSGNDFSYQRTDSGFKIYSWGRNMKDDRGLSDDKNSDKGDVVWVCEK